MAASRWASYKSNCGIAMSVTQVERLFSHISVQPPPKSRTSAPFKSSCLTKSSNAANREIHNEISEVMSGARHPTEANELSNGAGRTEWRVLARYQALANGPRGVKRGDDCMGLTEVVDWDLKQ